MALVKWRDEFAIGIPSIDHEHKEMIALINGVYDKLKRGDRGAPVADFLGEIYTAISAHFALEETMMREQAYFEYEAHKADHEQLLEMIREIMDNYEIGIYLDYEDTLAAHLNDWFSEHFKTMDARLHSFLD